MKTKNTDLDESDELSHSIKEKKDPKQPENPAYSYNLISRCNTAKNMARLQRATSISAHKHSWKKKNLFNDCITPYLTTEESTELKPAMTAT